MTYPNTGVLETGEKISIVAGKLSVPDHPILPYVEGDGTGRDMDGSLCR
jgi:isocitrate dehydrogenase